MCNKTFAVHEDDDGKHLGVIPAPEILIVDAGCWTENYENRSQYFAAVSGSDFVVGTFSEVPGDSLPATVKNERLRKLFKTFKGGSGEITPKVVPGYSRKIRPLDYVDTCEEETLLTKQNELFVFIPDCHLGLRDAADDFAFHGRSLKKDSILRNLDDLHTFLTGIKGADIGATVIQLGDFYDIWEAEAALHIYYLHTPPPGVDYIMAGDTKEDWRPRKARAELAASSITEAWSREDTREKFTDVIKSIDVFLPGNHDAEILLLEGVALQSKVPKAGGQIGSLHAPARTRIQYRKPALAVDSAWCAEHGNRFDSYNDTSSADGYEALMKVEGKPITFAWTRRERGEYILGESHVPIFDGDGKIVGYRERVGKLYGTGLRDPLDNATLTETHLRSLRGVFSSEGERFNFWNMRQRLCDQLIADTRALNPSFEFSGTVGLDTQEFFCFWWSDSSGRPKLPTRLFIHGHTHGRFMQRITFVKSPPSSWADEMLVDQAVQFQKKRESKGQPHLPR